MTKKVGEQIDRRKFMEKSVKTMAVIYVGSALPISVALNSCSRDGENKIKH